MHYSIGNRAGSSATCLILVFSLSACGGGGDAETKSSLAFDGANLVDTTISGSVGDGPITDGRVVVQNVGGDILATQRSSDQARYRMLLSVSSDEYPLTARVDDGTDLVTGDRPSFALVTAVLQPGGEQVANLNPFGTIAVKIAQQLAGGLTTENLNFAVNVVTRNLGFGVDARSIINPVSAPIVKQNAASIVRSSEALGETIRRTYSALLSSGNFGNEDELIDALSADLTDGALDGRGPVGSDPRLAATTSVVSAQVMLEVIANRLKVGDVVATQALDSSIQQVMGGDLTVPLTATLNVTGSMLNQVRLLVDAATRIDASAALGSVSDALALVEPGQSPAEVAALLPLDAGAVLGETVQQVTLATDAELELLNDAVREATPPAGQAGNRLPTIFGSPAPEVMVGSDYQFAPTAADADGDALTFAVAGLPAWASFDTATGRVSGVPAEADIGTSAPLQISVSDGFGDALLPEFRITVLRQPNRLPTISGTAPATVTIGNLYSFTPFAADPDGDPLAFSVTNLPPWATFDPGSGAVSGIPGPAQAGVYSGIQISVADAEDRASLPPFMITVSGTPNQAPAILGNPGTQIMVGNSYVFTPSASDADGDSLSFSIVGLPRWASFDAGNGRLSGTPAAGDEGFYSGVRISVTDGRDTASLPTFSILVDPVPNAAPTISGSPPASVTVGAAYTFMPSAADADGDDLSFSIAGRPGWASFDAGNGRLSGTPAAGDDGTYPGIRISVSDGRDTASLPTFSIVVDAPPNSAPTIAGAPTTSVTAGTAYSFTPSAADADGDGLSFSVAGRPAWASFDAGTGQLSGTPFEGEEGVYSNIRISVSDGQESTSLPTFAITVNDFPNTPPTISGSPATAVTVGEAYSFSPTAADADGDSLSFSIAGLPGWASFDSTTGRLFGVPVAGNEGTHSGIRINVSDGRDSASLGVFAISVAGLPNSPPTIGGTPAAQVTVGAQYSFTPSASDPDGDNLTFSVSGKPDWASFDTSNGSLSGTPVAGDEGSYAGISISVSDGNDSATLGDFAVTVVAQTSGNARLTWDAPSENEDGTFLDDLAGFKVYYGPALDNYTQIDTIDNPTVTTHLVENLGPGTWFFVVTAYDTIGNESVYSEVESKTIP